MVIVWECGVGEKYLLGGGGGGGGGKWRGISMKHRGILSGVWGGMELVGLWEGIVRLERVVYGVKEI
jgi:hypothetical protein